MERQEVNFLLEGVSVFNDAELSFTYHSDDLPDAVDFTDFGNGYCEFIWQTNIGDAGEYTADFTLSDGEHELTSTTRIIVEPFPLRWLNLPDTASVVALDTLRQELNGLSLIEGDTLRITAHPRTLPQGAGITDHEDGTAEFVWTPALADTGDYRVVFYLSNGEQTLPGLLHILVRAPESVPPASAMPSEFALHPPSPNPFNSSTTLRFDLPKPDAVKLTIFDTQGRFIATLVDQTLGDGSHAIEWDASALPAAVYLARMETGTGFTAAQKVIFAP